MFDYRLKFVRERNGIKQIEMAKELGINKSTYSNYESERNIIPIKHLIDFCDKCKVSVDYLFGFTNKSYSEFKKGINVKISSIRLKDLRESLKISQEAFARVIKTKRSIISGYEIGTQIISTKNLFIIS